MTSSFYTLYEHAPKGLLEKEHIQKGFILKWIIKNLLYCHQLDKRYQSHINDLHRQLIKDGVTYKEVAGTPAEQEELEKSYEHLCKLRDEVIEMGIIPAIKDWHALNPNID